LQSSATSQASAPNVPLVYFTDSTAAIAPGNIATEQLHLTAAQGSPVTLPIQLLGSAADQVDYTLTVSGDPTNSPASITFQPGQTSKTITIATLNTLHANAITVNITLLNATTHNAKVGNPNAYTLTIADEIFGNGFD